MALVTAPPGLGSLCRLLKVEDKQYVHGVSQFPSPNKRKQPARTAFLSAGHRRSSCFWIQSLFVGFCKVCASQFSCSSFSYVGIGHMPT